MTTPTRDDVDALKREWLNDPCWDIEDTEGFEAYRDELAAWAAEQHKRWAAEQQERIHERSVSLGIPGNYALTEHLLFVEERLQMLFREIQEVRHVRP